MKYLIMVAGLLLTYVSYANFTDNKLRILLRENDYGLIYVWSPGMPLSEKGLVEIDKICKELGITLTAAIDPNAKAFINEDAQYDQLRQQSIDNKLQSYTLQKQGALDHFPAMIFYKDGKIITPIIHGYEQINGMKKFIKRYIGEINEK